MFLKITFRVEYEGKISPTKTTIFANDSGMPELEFVEKALNKVGNTWVEDDYVVHDIKVSPHRMPYVVSI